MYLRTGRRKARIAAIELKFNPWHDPDNGRFTFAGQGSYFGNESGQRNDQSQADARSADRARGARSAARSSRGRSPNSYSAFDPRNPRNWSIHVVQRGETLTRIAAKRKGLRAADLAELNGLSPNRPLQIGERLKLPNQSYLDSGREARNKFLSLSHYMDTHGGRLPPNLASPPPLHVQIEAAGVRTVTANNYDFHVDVLDRARRISGQLQLKQERRSKREQRDAGKPDRHPVDDGGHYIAVRFNGPRERFNHFAQDRNFNRGAYLTLENRWAKAIGEGKRVFVDIVPQYDGMSRRPYSLNVVWYVDGERYSESFPNGKEGK